MTEEDVARFYIRHLLGQIKELFTENWMLRQSLYQVNDSVAKEHWDTIIKIMMQHP